MKEFSINKINESVKGILVGPKDTKINGLALVNLAKANELTLIGNKKYIADLADSKASAVIVDNALKDLIPLKDNLTYLFVDNADLAMAKALRLFSKEAPQHKVIHPSAVIDENVTFGENVTVGPNSYIGKNCVIGDNTVIYANVTIYDDCKIGANTIIWSASVIRENTIIGDYCHLSANCSIGNEGFGYIPDENGDGLYRIPHIGNVVIGNHVDIGANSCIDKGKFSSTVIGDYSKIDNLVQIGHNCIIGKRVVVCGAAGISGSVTIGDGATIAGGAGIKDHIYIGKNAVVTARAGVIQDVPDGETHAGFPADLYKNTMRQWLAIRHLPQTIKTVKQLVKKAEENK